MSELETFDIVDTVMNYEDLDSVIEELQQHCLDTEIYRGYKDDMDIIVDGVVEQMSVGRVLANLILLFPYRQAGTAPDSSRIVRKQLNVKEIFEHFDATTAELYHTLDFETLNNCMSAVVSFMSDMGSSITTKTGTSFSIKSIFEAAEQDQEIWKLLNWNMESDELGVMEQNADAANMELIRRFSAQEGTELSRLIRCGSAINKDQFRQAFLNIGIKPGLTDGEIIPEPINTSFLRGMRNVEDFYICAGSARKALTTNFKEVKASGYLSRKLVLLVADQNIDSENDDCNTIHGIHTLVQSEDHAKRLVARYYSTDDSPKLHLIRSNADALPLVGKQILLRSPATCAGKNGVCRVCYGEMYKSNKDIHAGIYGVLVISAQIIQRLLSSKHLLKARPTQIDWPDTFLSAFNVYKANITADTALDKVSIRFEDLEEDDEDEDRRKTSVIYYKTNKGVKHRVDIPVPIYLDSVTWNSEYVDMDEDELILSPRTDMHLFQIPVSNNDLSEALYSMFNLIEREENENIETMYERFSELMTKTNLEASSVHIEFIIRALVRNGDKLNERPDFSTVSMPPYVMLKLSSAILNSSSLSNSLAFERVKAQLTGFEIFNKTLKGALDILFT